jgi:hypothetical protein
MATPTLSWAHEVEQILSHDICLPRELSMHIVNEAMAMGGPAATPQHAQPPHPQPPRLPPMSTGGSPSVPPANGASIFMRLPAELRKEIFEYFLPARTREFEPKCEDDDDDDDACKKKISAKDGGNDEDALARPNRTSNLMTVHKVFREEIATIMYEESTFVINVHEGLAKAGIEFLDTTRQPLQYQDEGGVYDHRFKRFSHGDKYGFDRLKKIKIIIYPADLADALSRHMPINTYFINLALCELLKRSLGKEEENKINRLTIIFAERARGKSAVQEISRQAIMRAEQYWWDSTMHKPRATSIHNLSNVEIALRPFSTLQSHNVDIYLPRNVRDHLATVAFVNKLKRVMTDPAENLREYMMGDYAAAQIQSARYAMEEHVINVLHGKGKNNEVPFLTDGDLVDSDDEENGASKRKSNNSPAGNGLGKRLKPSDQRDLAKYAAAHPDQFIPEHLLDEDPDFQRAIQDSIADQVRHGTAVPQGPWAYGGGYNSRSGPSRQGYHPRTNASMRDGFLTSASNPVEPERSRQDDQEHIKFSVRSAVQRGSASVGPRRRNTMGRTTGSLYGGDMPYDPASRQESSATSSSRYNPSSLRAASDELPRALRGTGESMAAFAMDSSLPSTSFHHAGNSSNVAGHGARCFTSNDAIFGTYVPRQAGGYYMNTPQHPGVGGAAESGPGRRANAQYAAPSQIAENFQRGGTTQDPIVIDEADEACAQSDSENALSKRSSG